MKKLIKVAAPVVLAFSLVSCSSLGGFISDLTADIAAEQGFISKDTANRVKEAVEKSTDASQGFTVEQEYSIGRGVASAILSNYSLYENDELTVYVNLILQSLIANSETLEMINGYHAAVLDTNEINAFATSGGHILVTKGLVNCAKSEDELACVLAHELAHIQLGHNINAITADRMKEAGKAWGEAIFAAAADKIDGMKDLQNDFGNVIDSGSKLFDSGYPQIQEFAADKKALEYVAAAGYNVNAMENVLNMIEKNTKPGDTGFGKNHPSPADRKKNLSNQYRLYPANKTEEVRASRFNQIMNQL